MKVKDIAKATKIEVSDGHPDNAGGETYFYLRIDGLWYEDGDTNENPMTDKDQARCHDLLRAWQGEELVIDRKAELITEWEAQ